MVGHRDIKCDRMMTPLGIVRTIVIKPGQGAGSGFHGSTRINLEKLKKKLKF
jgi:ribosomal protein L11 methylase PrmA